MGLSLAIVNGRLLHPNGTMSKGGLLIGTDGRIKKILPAGFLDPMEWETPVWNADELLILPGIIDSYGPPLTLTATAQTDSSSLRAEIDYFKAYDLRACAAGVSTTCYRLYGLSATGPHGITQATRWIAAFGLCQADLRCRSRLQLHYAPLARVAYEQVLGWLTAKSISTLWLANTDHFTRTDQELLSFALQCGITLGATGAQSPADWRAVHEYGGSVCAFPKHDTTARLARTLGNEVLLCAETLLHTLKGSAPLNPYHAISDGLGTLLASAGRPQALIPAAFALAEHNIAYLTDAWGLLSSHPAHAFRLGEQGSLSPGQQADFLVIQPACRATGTPPALRASFIGGSCVYRSAKGAKPSLPPTSQLLQARQSVERTAFPDTPPKPGG